MIDKHLLIDQITIIVLEQAKYLIGFLTTLLRKLNDQFWPTINNRLLLIHVNSNDLLYLFRILCKGTNIYLRLVSRAIRRRGHLIESFYCFKNVLVTAKELLIFHT